VQQPDPDPKPNEAHQNAGVVGGPIRDIVQLTQQLGVVLRVGGSLTGKPGRPNPWRSIERHAADTGVVGKRRQSSFCRRVPRLGERVFDKRLKRLNGCTHTRID